MQKALRDYRGGKFPNIRKAATRYKVDFTTRSRRLQGTEPAHEAHSECALQTPVQEDPIVQMYLLFDCWGLPVKLTNNTGLAFQKQDPEMRRQLGKH